MQWHCVCLCCLLEHWWLYLLFALSSKGVSVPSLSPTDSLKGPEQVSGPCHFSVFMLFFCRCVCVWRDYGAMPPAQLWNTLKNTTLGVPGVFFLTNSEPQEAQKSGHKIHSCEISCSLNTSCVPLYFSCLGRNGAFLIKAESLLFSPLWKVVFFSVCCDGV